MSNEVRAGAAFVELFAEDSKLVRGLRQASKGSDAASDKLAALGLRYDDLKKKSPEEQFLTLVSRLGGVRDSNQRAAIAMGIFGESANKLLPLIDAGADSIEEMRAEARKLGISMSGEDAKAAADYTDALSRLYSLFRGVTNHIGAALAPELTRLVNWFTKGVSPIVEWIDRNKELIVTIAKWAAIIAGVGAGLMVAGGIVIGFGAVIGALGTIISAVLATIGTILAGVATVIGFLLTPIGAVLAALVGFGAYFLYTSGTVDDAVSWMKASFMSLFSTATKAWQGISDALAAGRLDLVFKVAWTAIKLVWTDGVNFLYEKWLWLSGTIQEVWAGAVYGISNVLVRAWSGIQTIWTEAVYGMQAIWAGFSQGIIDAWKTAERYVAKGIAWIYAKLSGMDATEMMRIVDEGYDQQQKDRDQKQAGYLNTIGKIREEKLGRINSERTGTLDALKDDYQRKQDVRKSSYQKELDDMEKARIEAEKEFNDAVKEAGDVRVQTETDAKARTLAKKAQEETVAVAGKEVKLASTGTFNAAAVQGLQAQGPMDQIAKNTADTAKYAKKQYEKTPEPATAAGDD